MNALKIIFTNKIAKKVYEYCLVVIWVMLLSIILMLISYIIYNIYFHPEWNCEDTLNCIDKILIPFGIWFYHFLLLPVYILLYYFEVDKPKKNKKKFFKFMYIFILILLFISYLGYYIFDSYFL